jgi:hypothetical protein
MFNKIDQEISSGDNSLNVIVGQDFNLTIDSGVPTEIIDQHINEEIEKLRRKRLFGEFDRIEFSLRLGTRLLSGNLSKGTANPRGRGLAFCARILARSKEIESAESFLNFAKSLGDFTESIIAETFITAQKQAKEEFRKVLAAIDIPASRSACFNLIAFHNGPIDALTWMRDAGYSINDFDPDGKFFVISQQLHLENWDEAADTSRQLFAPDFDQTPALYHLAALAILISTVPLELRHTVIAQVPFDSCNFPLDSGSVALEARNKAYEFFLKANEEATKLACPIAANLSEEYALWLELVDPTKKSQGIKRLENRLQNSDQALGFVHHAMQVGLKLDLSKVEQSIERVSAKNGGLTPDAALARFSLVFAQPTPEEAASYLAKHYDQLCKHIEPTLLQYRQIEFLCGAGLIEGAKEVLITLLAQGIPEKQEIKLRNLISEASENNPIESRKSKYEKSGELTDLIDLVHELRSKQHWNDLYNFGSLLFSKTQALAHAELVVTSLRNTDRSKELVDFLKGKADFLAQSIHLRMSYAWALYYEGDLLEARTRLANESKDEACHPNYRALQVNIWISIGDWPCVYRHIEDEYQNRKERSAKELIQSAQLALHLGLPRAKDLIVEATKQAGEDPTIFAAAYFTATSAGYEDDPVVSEWLGKAITLSGEAGPLHRISLKEILDQKPDWDRHESDTVRAIVNNSAPIFLAAQTLNRSLIQFFTFPALVNILEPDLRRRIPIAAYSGKRTAPILATCDNSIAIDATALLTLGFLDLLDTTLNFFSTVYIPHSTLWWLFDECQKAAFHQPSRVKHARTIRDLVATSKLQKFNSTVVVKSDFSAQIGENLAALILEAERANADGAKQHIVVRPSPVHRVGSLMEEEVDLSQYAPMLSSCLAVVEKLKQKAVITGTTEKRAREYLHLHEKSWPNQPEIKDGAVLYLDDLSITYLQHLGLLDKLQMAGLTAIASSRELEEVDELIAYDRNSVEVKNTIERIRRSLNSGIESGHIKLGKKTPSGDEEPISAKSHPSVDIFNLTALCDLAIIDDRFFNRHAQIDSNGHLKPVLTTLDLVDSLRAAGTITEEQLLEYRTTLRRAGYLLIPITSDELNRCLVQSTVSEGEVIESTELKAIRESLLRVRMSDYLQLPEEAVWLDGMIKTVVKTLKHLWETTMPIEECLARSNWLERQIDIRGWAHRFNPDHAENMIQVDRAMIILQLLTPPNCIEVDRVEAYWDWIEKTILTTIRDQFPAVYQRIVEWHRRYAAIAVKKYNSDEDLQ